MVVDNGLIRDALLRAAPDDLDDVLTAIEGYLVAAWEVLPQGRIHGLQDAIAVIRARFYPAVEPGDSPTALRTIIVVVGTIGLWRLLTT